MSRIINYQLSSAPVSGDVFIIDNSSGGTKKLPIENLLDGDLTSTFKAAKGKAVGDRLDAIESSIDTRFDSLEDEMNNLRNETNLSFDIFANADWVLGGLTGTGEDTSSNTRYRTDNYIPITEDMTKIIIGCKTGYKFYVVLYDETKTCIPNILHFYTWRTSNLIFYPLDCPTAKYFRLQMQKSSSTVDEGDYVNMYGSYENGFKKIVNSYDDIYKAFPKNTVSDSVVNVKDGGDHIPAKIVVNIDPVQAGTGDPAPDNVRAISGRTSCNVYTRNKNFGRLATTYTENLNGLEITSYGNGDIRVRGTRTSTSGNWATTPVNNPVYLRPGRYIISLSAEGVVPEGENIIQVGFSGTYGGYAKLSPPTTMNAVYSFPVYTDEESGIRKAGVFTYSTYFGPGTYDCVIKFQVERAASASDFVPSEDSSVTIPFPIPAGDVYGGSLTINEDGSADLVSHPKITNPVFTGIATDPTSGVVIVFSGVDRASEIIACDSLTIGGAIREVNHVQINLDGRIIISPDWIQNLTTMEEFNAAYASHPLELVVSGGTKEGFTDTTYHFTADQVRTLLGENNIWADCGEVEVKYSCDPNIYIDEKLNATKSIIAGIETSMVASKNYSVGDILIVGDKLYKATASIAVDVDIEVGTNVAETTVAEQLLLALS